MLPGQYSPRLHKDVNQTLARLLVFTLSQNRHMHYAIFILN